MTLIRTRLAALAAAVTATAAATVAGTAGPAAAAPTTPDRPAVARYDNVWQLRNALSAGGATTTFRYGGDDDFPVTGDWDGNGSRTVGAVRLAADNRLYWYLRNGNSAGGASVAVFAFGSIHDIPVVGDWDGNGTDTVGVVRTAADGTPHWLLRNANNAGGASLNFQYGPRSFYPIVGDWDGNGTDTIGAIDVSGSALRWRLRDSNTAGGANRDFQYGSTATDYPIAGDWDGDGGWGAGVARPNSAGRWAWKLRETPTAGGATYSFDYGTAANSYPQIWH